MGKKDKQAKKKVRQIGQIQEFDDLETFEQFIKDERDDKSLSNSHAHVSYIPPFVMAASHNDVEKIKPAHNRKNKKFVRHLHQHVKKHLLKDIQENSGLDLNWKEETIEDFDTLTWKYTDETNHGLDGELGNFKVQVVVKCNSNGAMIDVNYDTIPLVATDDLEVPV